MAPLKKKKSVPFTGDILIYFQTHKKEEEDDDLVDF